MKRSRKVLMVCHCLLNANAKIYPLALTGGVYREVLEGYIRDGTGIFQLPCHLDYGDHSADSKRSGRDTWE